MKKTTWKIKETWRNRVSELKRTGIMPKDLDTSCGTGNSEHLVISEKLGVSVEFIWFRGQYGWIEIIAGNDRDELYEISGFSCRSIKF